MCNTHEHVHVHKCINKDSEHKATLQIHMHLIYLNHVLLMYNT